MFLASIFTPEKIDNRPVAIDLNKFLGNGTR